VRVLRLSLEEARARGSASIRTEHLLLGVLRINDHIARTILERSGVSVRRSNRKWPNHNHRSQNLWTSHGAARASANCSTRLRKRSIRRGDCSRTTS